RWEAYARGIPEFQSWAAFNYTKEHDPARYAQVMKELQAAKTWGTAAANRWNELNEIRHSRATRWAQAQGAQHAQYQRQQAAQRTQLNERADNEFNNWLSRAYPEFNTKAGFKQLRAAARETLKEETGWNDQQLDAAWNNGLIRSPAAQKFITHAAVQRLQKQNRESLQNHRARIPQPQAPSVPGLRHNDAEADINALQRRLEGQSGRNAIMTAVELQKARRRAGRVG